MDTITININNHSITEKLLWFLDHFKKDEIEIIKQSEESVLTADEEFEKLFKYSRKNAFVKGDLCDTIDDWGDV